jgi:hypothetical protein
MSLAEYPGFSAFSVELQTMLLAAESGDHERRPQLLERVAEAINVFVGLDLLEYVFMPPAQDGPEGVTIDLISPTPDESAIAWFAIDEAGYDEFRDAVTLFGDLTDVLNPPIVLDVDDGEGDGL